MKTDRFTDIIRRKLESIRPEFTEKDWARMQATLQQANLPQPDLPNAQHPFTGGVWSSGQSWWLAAASVSAVALAAVGMWQRSEINHLRQTVSQLNRQKTVQQSQSKNQTPAEGQGATQTQLADSKRSQTTVPGEPIATVNQHKAIPVQRDTVYITRYITVPSPTRMEVPNGERFDRSNRQPAADQRYATTNGAPVSAGSPRTGNSTTSAQPNILNDVTSTPVTNISPDKATNESVTTAIPSNKTTTNRLDSPASPANRTDAGTNLYVRQRVTELNSVGNNKEAIANRGASQNAGRPTTSGNNSETVTDNTQLSTGAPIEAANQLATYELMASRPLELGSINWGKALAQRSRQMRPARVSKPAVPAVEQAPESQRVAKAGIQVRTGLGGEFDSRMWSAGAFGEVILNRHWALGAGISQATYMSGTFYSAPDFDARTHRDFRQEFAPKLDPKRDIWNIDTRMVRLQIPLTLGYRVPLNKSFALTPTVGTYLNLSQAQNGTFDYFEPQRGLNQVDYSVSCSVDLINSFTLGTPVEWQRNHWAIQAGPIVTVPTVVTTQPGPSWANNTTLGLRARILYQF